MKRTSIPVVLLSVLAVAACTSSPGSNGSITDGSTLNGPTSTSDYTVSGRITREDTGAPYPNAAVRFGSLVNAEYEQEAHTVTDGAGQYAIQLPAGQYQATAVDTCDLNAGFAIVGRAPDDVMVTVPGAGEVDFVEQPITPGADISGVC